VSTQGKCLEEVSRAHSLPSVFWLGGKPHHRGVLWRSPFGPITGDIRRSGEQTVTTLDRECVTPREEYPLIERQMFVTVNQHEKEKDLGPA